MQLSQKRCPHSVCRGLQSTRLQDSQQYLASGVVTKRSLNPPSRGKKPGSDLGRWAMEGTARDGGRCCRAICCSTLRPADMTWRKTPRLESKLYAHKKYMRKVEMMNISVTEKGSQWLPKTWHPETRKMIADCQLWHMKFFLVQTEAVKISVLSGKHYSY